MMAALRPLAGPAAAGRPRTRRCSRSTCGRTAPAVLAHAVFLGLPGLGAAGAASAWALVALPLTAVAAAAPAIGPAGGWRRRPGVTAAWVAAGRRAAALTVHTAVNAAAGCAGPPAARDRSASGSRCCCRCGTRRTGSALPGRRCSPSAACPTCGSLVLDDGSTDGTADVVRARGRRRPRVTLLTGAAAAAGLAGQAARLPAAGRRGRPGADVLVFVDADVVLAPDAVAAAVAAAAATGVDLLSPYPRSWRGTRGRAAGAAAAAVVVADVPAAAGDGALAAAVAGRGRRAVPGRRPGRLRPGRRARRGARRGARGRRAGPGGQAGRRPDRARRRLRAGRPAGCTTAGRSCATATPSRCGRRSARPAGGGRRGGPAARCSTSLRRCRAVGRAGAGPRSRRSGRLRCSGVAGRVVTARATGGRAWPDALAHPVSVVLFAAG